MLEQLMTEIFRAAPHEKQAMMLTTTLSKDTTSVCKKFMQEPMDVYIEDDAALLYGKRGFRSFLWWMKIGFEMERYELHAQVGWCK